MGSRVALCILVTACGRVGFDPLFTTDGQPMSTKPSPAQHSYLKASNTQPNQGFAQYFVISADGQTIAACAPAEASNATGINGNQSNVNAFGSGAVYVFVRSGASWMQQAYVKASNTGGQDLFGLALALSADGSTLAVGSFREDSSAIGVGGNQADNATADAGAVYVFTRAGTTWSQQAYLKASNTGAGDHFGSFTSLSDDGNTLAVAADQEDSSASGVGGNQADNNAGDAGAVYVFTRAGTTWSQEAYLKASNTDTGDRFGTWVALSGNGETLLVTANGESSAAGMPPSDNSATKAGAAYVFTRAGTTWVQQAFVKASTAAAGDELGDGAVIAADGMTMALGAPYRGNERGAAYVFTRNGQTWTERAYIESEFPSDRARFGYNLAMSADGTLLVVGAESEASAARGVDGNQQDQSATGAGAAFIFDRVGAAWVQRSYLKASNSEANDTFADTVAVSGDGLLIGASARTESSDATGIDGDQNNNNAPSAGALYLFE